MTSNNIKGISIRVATGLGFVALALFSQHLIKNKINERCENMKEIKAKNPQLYFRLLEETAATPDGIIGMSTAQINELWKSQRQRMEDSLKIDSLANASYGKALINKAK